MQNEDLIIQFYESFARADAEGMVKCYHRDIEFRDPAFGLLKGNDACNMWRMLIERSKGNIKINFSDAAANGKTGSANWIAEYNFGQTGRKVINSVAAAFEFMDGKIIKHTDHFDLYKWARQALGWKGYLLGWSSFMQNRIRQNCNALLKKYSGK